MIIKVSRTTSKWRAILVGCLVLLATRATGFSVAEEAPSPIESGASSHSRSVLLVMFDDLRADVTRQPFLGMRSMPNLESFARTAVTFRRAFADYPLCNPSRVSILTGRAPSVSEVYSLFTDFRYSGYLTGAREWKTLPQVFKESGYTTGFAGKVFHEPFHDSAHSWSDQRASLVQWGDFPGHNTVGCTVGVRTRKDVSWKAFTMKKAKKSSPGQGWQCRTSTKPQLLEDYVSAATALKRLSEMKPDEKFFMAVGFIRPHVPHLVHDKFWNNRYKNKLNAKQLDPFPLTGPKPKASVHPSYFAWLEKTFPNTRISTNPWKATAAVNRRALRIGYAAAARQADDAFGVLLSGLDALKLSDRTAVVVVSDHGFAMGEHGLWGKQTLLDVSTRVPLLMRFPWLTRSEASSQVSHFVSVNDVYRTLIDAFDLTRAAGDLSTTQSRSLLPLLRNPRNTSFSEFPDHAFSQNARCFGLKKGCDALGSRIDAMGFSVRTPEWRYSAWFPWNKTSRYPDFDRILARELYSIVGADDEYDEKSNANQERRTFQERKNVAKDFASTCEELHALILAKFRRGPPPAGSNPAQPNLEERAASEDDM